MIFPISEFFAIKKMQTAFNSIIILSNVYQNITLYEVYVISRKKPVGVTCFRVIFVTPDQQIVTFSLSPLHFLTMFACIMKFLFFIWLLYSLYVFRLVKYIIMIICKLILDVLFSWKKVIFNKLVTMISCKNLTK